METTQVLEAFGGSMKISDLEMSDKRPESKTPAKLAAIEDTPRVAHRPH